MRQGGVHAVFVYRMRACKVRTFTCFQRWCLHLQIMINSYAGLKDQEARQHLGSFGLSGPLALQPMYTLSGGQKSRVALAKVGGSLYSSSSGARKTTANAFFVIVHVYLDCASLSKCDVGRTVIGSGAPGGTTY
jgi:hypothetical protein